MTEARTIPGFSFFHRLLHSDRDAIPEVPAIYFVLPTEENVKRICQVGVGKNNNDYCCQNNTVNR